MYNKARAKRRKEEKKIKEEKMYNWRGYEITLASARTSLL
jgi:hypothetical protein